MNFITKHGEITKEKKKEKLGLGVFLYEDSPRPIKIKIAKSIIQRLEMIKTRRIIENFNYVIIVKNFIYKAKN